MDLKRAQQVTAQCVRSCMVHVLGGELVPLPDCSLEEMLQANRLVQENNKASSESAKPGADGKHSYSIDMVVDPRMLAAVYAFERYGRSPVELLGALGIQVDVQDD